MSLVFSPSTTEEKEDRDDIASDDQNRRIELSIEVLSEVQVLLTSIETNARNSHIVRFCFSLTNSQGSTPPLGHHHTKQVPEV